MLNANAMPSVFLLFNLTVPLHIWPAILRSLQNVHAKIPNAHRLRRRLNILPFPNVLEQTLPLLPINGRSLDSYDHVDSDVVIFLDAECAGSKSNANHLRQELLNEQDCYLENDHIPGIVTKDDSFYFFLQRDTTKNSDCLDEGLIDLEAFCISKIEYEQQFFPSSANVPDCVDYAIDPTVEGTWWFDDINGDLNLPVYQVPMWDESNVLVYVVDTAVNLKHEHFDHIPDANKEILGKVYANDSSDDHGMNAADCATWTMPFWKYSLWLFVF